MFQEYSRAIGQLYPDMRIEGQNYPPGPINKYAHSRRLGPARAHVA